MKIYVKIGQKVVGKGKSVKSCLKYVSKLFREGKTDVYLSGGKIGSWKE
jgi:hypothetical protein